MVSSSSLLLPSLCLALILLLNVLVLDLFSSALFALGQSDIYLPYPVPTVVPSIVYEIEYQDRSIDDQLLLTSLQGRLAHRALTTPNETLSLLYKVVSATMNISHPIDDDNDLRLWDYYVRHYPNVKWDNETLVHETLDKILTVFRDKISGYILTVTPTDNTDPVSVAISMAAIINHSIIATEQHLSLMKSLNLSLLLDVRQLYNGNETAFIGSFAPFNKSRDAIEWPWHRRFYSCQIPSIASQYLSDWTIMNGVVMFHHLSTATMILEYMTTPQPVFTAWFGWTPDWEYEDYWLHSVSRSGGLVWASDTLSNMATHAFFRQEKLINPTKMNPSQLPDNTNKHAVAFLWTGHNKQK